MGGDPTSGRRTMVCAAIMVGEVGDALIAADLARAKGADLVEYRVDDVFAGEGDDEGLAAVLELAERSPMPCIVTCRGSEEGGGYGGDDSSRLSLYEALGTGGSPPAYLDLEHAVYARSANVRQKAHLAVDDEGRARRGGSRLILSAHDFQGRPQGLLRLVAEMRETRAHVLKVAFRARSLRDNLEVFDLLRERDRPTIALAMGEYGLMSRVLAPKFGGMLTFASLSGGGETAPGQPTVDELLGLYRFDAIGAGTKVYGVVGDPVGHSISPRVHNAAFDAAGFDGVYLPMPISGGDGDVEAGWLAFKATVLAMLDHDGLDLGGLSVTLPHKENLLRLAREMGWGVDAYSEVCGAANTLRVGGGGEITVANTDAMAIAEIAPGFERALVLGAGGVARAAVAALRGSGEVVVANRTAARAEALAGELGVRGVAWEDRHGVGADLVVNATSVGMAGGPAGSAFDFGRVGGGGVALDTVYTPRETAFLVGAREAGWRGVDGLEMFARQAAHQSWGWVGGERSRLSQEFFMQSAEKALASRR